MKLSMHSVIVYNTDANGEITHAMKSNITKLHKMNGGAWVL
jgi:hypothetical protein